MIEDEQILLQNLSSDLLQVLQPFINPVQIKFEGDHLHQWEAEDNKIITEKQNARKFYIDWNQADNHQYFTKHISEEIQDASRLELPQVQTAPTHLQTQKHHPDYRELSKKLEMALNLIKRNHRVKEVKSKQKRSQSNQPRKQRQKRCLTKTGFVFKGQDSRQRKTSMNYRMKTEFEEDSIIEGQYPFQQNKMEKYQTHHIITEENEPFSAEQYCKENTLRNKFLDSIALWQEKKEKRIQERIEKQLKLTMEGVTFTPEINAKSREIMKKKGVVTPIYERQHRDKKRELTQRLNVNQKPLRVKL